MHNIFILRVLLVSCFGLYSLSGLAQSEERIGSIYLGVEQPKNSYISFNFGVAQPLGAFANKYPSNSSNSFAGIGFHREFTLAFGITEKYRLCLSSLVTTHQTNNQNFINDFSGSTPGAGDVFNGDWESYYLMLGFLRVFDLSKSLQLESGPMIGWHISYIDETRAYNLDGPPGSPRSVYLLEKESTSVLGLGARAKLRYNWKNKLCFFSTVDFLWANPSVEDREISINFDRIIQFTSFKQQVAAVAFSLGFGFYL
jgi:hypothetical protein